MLGAMELEGEERGRRRRNRRRKVVVRGMR